MPSVGKAVGPTGKARGPLAPLALLAVAVAVALALPGARGGAAAATPPPAEVPQVQAYSDSAALDGPTPAALSLPQAKEGIRAARADPGADATARANLTSAVVGPEGPRRRPREQWDLMGPAMLLGGTLALLVLAAVGHLASKALLASMLSAALSAVQLGRQPNGRRPG